ncbi:Type I iodothyronine deiodinase [Trichoplax sp. H2]|nr:Type I iodothyronine deiodinase [Trichoplax sp. H2]|eukprot:RDD47781.1 Type I iodothyronine deiodinase [Trichoplax sp. H2]
MEVKNRIRRACCPTGARIQIAKEFVDRFDYKLPFFVDTMEGDTMKAYGAQPERLYVVKDGKIAYEGGPGPFCYSIDDLEQFLEKLIANK